MIRPDNPTSTLRFHKQIHGYLFGAMDVQLERYSDCPVNTGAMNRFTDCETVGRKVAGSLHDLEPNHTAQR